jgi:phosphatidylglycerol:prolipoprotein diacylglycerol transferase
METFTIGLFVIRPVNVFGPVYASVLLLGLLFLLLVGFRRKYPLGSWLALVASVMVLFVTGMKLSAYTPAEWVEIFSGSHEGVGYVKYLPGGILLVALGLPLVRRFLHFRAPVFDSLVLFLPVLGIIQRTGCLLNGCCYGTHTGLPWAVHYSAPSPLYYQQLDAGLLPPGALHSLGVHPTQLYTILLSLAILGVLWLSRKRFRVPGSFTLFALLLMGGMRFFLEFFREPKLHTLSDRQWLFLNGLQWAILVLAAGFAIALWWREHKHSFSVDDIPMPREHGLRATVVVLLLIVGVWQLREVYDPLELMILYPLLFTSLLVLSARLLLQYGPPVSRLATGTLLLAAFFSMGQTLEESAADTLAFQPKGWFSLGAYGGAGSHEMVTRNCDGDITGRYRRDFTQWGSSAAYHYQGQPERHIEAGIRQFYLSDLIEEENYFDERYLIFSPYFSYDTRGFGGTAGVLYAFDRRNLPWPDAEQDNYFNLVLGLWAGRRDQFFFEIDMNNKMHFMGPPAFFQAGIGYGFNQYYASVARMGIMMDREQQAGLFFGGEALINNRLTLKPYLMVSRYPSFAFGVEYHFGRK